MARIRPLKGLRYDTNRYPELAALVSPPYDVIDDDGAAALRAHERNVAHLDYTGGADRYDEVARTLSDWQADGTLARDPRPALYVYEQTYALSDGTSRTRTGFFCLVALEPFGRSVHPHEQTHGAPRLDRQRLIATTRSNLSPVFSLYSDPAHTILDTLRAAPEGEEVSFKDDQGIEHRLAPVDDPAVLARVVESMTERDIFIADGHHRYEAALASADAAGAAGGHAGTDDHVLMYLTEIEDPGLAVLPIHRVLRGVDGAARERLEQAIERDFEVDVVADATALWERLDRHAGEPEPVIGWIGPRGCRYLRPASVPAVSDVPVPSAVATRVLPSEIFTTRILQAALGCAPEAAVARGHLRYASDWRAGSAAVERGDDSDAFLMAPTAVSLIADRARAGERMPPKSTFFFPKVPTGLVFHLFD